MSRLKSKQANHTRRANRVRKVIRGTAERPRLSVNVSLKNVTAQIVDDETGKTIVGSTSQSIKKGTLTEKATIVGADIAKLAKKKKINKVTLDRGARKYHGRVKALADAARKEGLEL